MCSCLFLSFSLLVSFPLKRLHLSKVFKAHRRSSRIAIRENGAAMLLYNYNSQNNNLPIEILPTRYTVFSSTGMVSSQEVPSSDVNVESFLDQCTNDRMLTDGLCCFENQASLLDDQPLSQFGTQSSVLEDNLPLSQYCEEQPQSIDDQLISRLLDDDQSEHQILRQLLDDQPHCTDEEILSHSMHVISQFIEDQPEALRDQLIHPIDEAINGQSHLLNDQLQQIELESQLPIDQLLQPIGYQHDQPMDNSLIQPIQDQPTDNSLQPIENQPTDNSLQPVENQPTDNSLQPIENQPTDNSLQPIQDQPTDNSLQPIQDQPTDNSLQPVENQPTDNSLQPVENQPTDNSLQPVENQPTDNSLQPQPTDNSLQPIQDQPTDNSLQPVENQPTDNSLQPQPTDNSLQPIQDQPTDNSLQPQPTDNSLQPIQDQPTDNSLQPIQDQPTDNSVQPIQDQPTDNSLQPIENQPTDNSLYPIQDQPTDNSLQPIQDQPTDNSLQPIQDQPMDNSLQPIENQPMDNLLQPVDEQQVVNQSQTIKDHKSLNNECQIHSISIKSQTRLIEDESQVQINCQSYDDLSQLMSNNYQFFSHRMSPTEIDSHTLTEKAFNTELYRKNESYTSYDPISPSCAVVVIDQVDLYTSDPPPVAETNEITTSTEISDISRDSFKLTLKPLPIQQPSEPSCVAVKRQGSSLHKTRNKRSDKKLSDVNSVPKKIKRATKKTTAANKVFLLLFDVF